MAGNKAAPLMDEKDLNARLVFDLVYNPLETPLIRLARQMSIPFITGVEMFVHQGARQFEIFTGKPAPEEEMFRVVLHALRRQAEAEVEASEAKTESKAKVEAPAKAAAKTVAKEAAKPKATAKPKAAEKAAAKPAAKKSASKAK